MSDSESNDAIQLPSIFAAISQPQNTNDINTYNIKENTSWLPNVGAIEASGAKNMTSEPISITPNSGTSSENHHDLIAKALQNNLFAQRQKREINPNFKPTAYNYNPYFNTSRPQNTGVVSAFNSTQQPSALAPFYSRNAYYTAQPPSANSNTNQPLIDYRSRSASLDMTNYTFVQEQPQFAKQKAERAPVSPSFSPPLDCPRRLYTRKRKSICIDSTGFHANKRTKHRISSQERYCKMCGTTTTSQWRRGPDGCVSLCNACGLHFQNILKSEKKHAPVPKRKWSIDFLLNPTNDEVTKPDANKEKTSSVDGNSNGNGSGNANNEEKSNSETNAKSNTNGKTDTANSNNTSDKKLENEEVTIAKQATTTNDNEETNSGRSANDKNTT